MPSKNRLKEYVSDFFYHAYNRGVEKRLVFLDQRDYQYFLYLLDRYLTPTESQVELEVEAGRYKHKNYAETVQLAAFCLMPNHVHFLLKQSDEKGMNEFFQSLMTSYVQYFNKRHKRLGSLFQDRYKAVAVTSDELLLHDSRYVHLNPEDLLGVDYKTYPYSSYQSYVGGTIPKWLHPELVLDLFAGHDYADFVAIQEKARPFPEKGRAFSDFPETADVFREMLE